jgi:hypothetical protein
VGIRLYGILANSPIQAIPQNGGQVRDPGADHSSRALFHLAYLANEEDTTVARRFAGHSVQIASVNLG